MSLSGFIYTFAVTSLAVSLVMETAEGREGALDRAAARMIVKAHSAAQTFMDAAQANPWLVSTHLATANDLPR